MSRSGSGFKTSPVRERFGSKPRARSVPLQQFPLKSRLLDPRYVLLATRRARLKDRWSAQFARVQPPWIFPASCRCRGYHPCACAACPRSRYGRRGIGFEDAMGGSLRPLRVCAQVCGRRQGHGALVRCNPGCQRAFGWCPGCRGRCHRTADGSSGIGTPRACGWGQAVS